MTDRLPIRKNGRPGRVARPGVHRADRVSLERLLSKFGSVSRSGARALIKHGRVMVNGRVSRLNTGRVDPRRDKVSIDGTRIRPEARLYLMLHKPGGVVTTRADELGRPTVYDLLPPGIPWVFPVGRLDRESSGLLLFTNDTKLGEALTNPARHVSKAYLVELDRPLDRDDQRRFQTGNGLKDGTLLRPIRIRHPNVRIPVYEFTLIEGKNRQIRRMCEESGYRVVRLHRIRVGPLLLAGLPPGKTRRLTEAELSSLLSGGSRGAQ